MMTTSQTIGIKRLIQRPGRKPYVQTEQLVCPFCGQSTRVEFEQCSGLPDHPSIILTHCTQRGCDAYFMTHSLAIFFQKFGAFTLQPDTLSNEAIDMKFERIFDKHIPSAEELADKSRLSIEQAAMILSRTNNIVDMNEAAWKSLHGYSFETILEHLFNPDATGSDSDNSVS